MKFNEKTPGFSYSFAGILLGVFNVFLNVLLRELKEKFQITGISQEFSLIYWFLLRKLDKFGKKWRSFRRIQPNFL